MDGFILFPIHSPLLLLAAHQGIIFASLPPFIQGENECLREQISAMNKELEITKEKLYTLEQAWESIGTTGTKLCHFHFRLMSKRNVSSLFIYD